jgi:hypothetical protein
MYAVHLTLHLTFHLTPMPSDLLGMLADELILEILAHILNDPLALGPNKYRAPISLLNKRLRRIVLPLLYRSVHIHDIKSLNGFHQIMVDYPTYAVLVKILELDWYCYERFEPPLRPLEKSQEEADPKSILLHLLYILQDLEVLDIMTGFRHDKEVFPYLSRFFDENRLSLKLRRLEWRRCDVRVAGLIPALLIPSMREFQCRRGQSVRSPDFEWPPDLPSGTDIKFWYKKSNVEELALTWGDLNGKEFVEIVQLPRHLKILSLRKEFYQLQMDHEISLRDLKQALGHVSKSLEFLDVFRDSYSGIQLDNELILPLHGFTALKFLSLNCSLLYGPQNSAAIERSLAKSLPPALEILFMCIDPEYWRDEYILDQWERILAEKSSTCLHNLWFIGQRNNVTLLMPLTDLANSRNVQVSHYIGDFTRLKQLYLSQIKQKQ